MNVVKTIKTLVIVNLIALRVQRRYKVGLHITRSFLLLHVVGVNFVFYLSFLVSQKWLQTD